MKQDTVFIQDENETRRFGLGLSEKMKAGDVIALSGELGTGKTTLTKYIAEGLGVTEDVTSPTFTIINEYRSGRLPLYHFDVYRLSCEEEFFELGGQEIICGDGVSIVEWADKIAGAIPEGSIIIRMSCGGGEYERVYEIYPSF